MEKIAFGAGNEKRFSDFISGLNEKDKIALISHIDIDGVVSAKVANSVLNADLLEFADYSELNEDLVKKLKDNKIKKTVFTDLFIKDKEFLKSLEKFSDVMIIDHHLFVEDLNSERTTFLNAQGYCGAYISYNLFSRAQNLENLDWLVAIACVADFQFTKNAEWMSEVYEKHSEKFEPNLKDLEKVEKFWKPFINLSQGLIYFRKDIKRVYDSLGSGFGEIGDLEKYAGEVDKEIKSLVRKFESEKKTIREGYFWEYESKFALGSYVTTEISLKYPNKTLVIGHTEDDGYYHFSARRQDGKENMNDLLNNMAREMVDASTGGHAKAAGGHIFMRDVEEFKKRLGVC